MSDLPTSDRSADVMESIPWETLGRPEPPDRRTWYLVAALAVAVAAISASAARTLWPAPPLQPPPTIGVEAVPVTPPVQDTAPTTAGSPDPSPATHALPTEADLMAIDPGHLERWVASHAEWFLAEWFTLDGTDRPSLEDLLPTGIPSAPSDPMARSFVESVSVRSVSSLGQGHYEVVAVVRLLSAGDGGAYVRQPATGFSVTIGVVDGVPAVVDTPSPVELETARAPIAPGEPAEPPIRVVDAAVGELGGFGSVDRSTLTATRHGAVWRVSASVEDVAGVRWPLAVWLDGEGRRTQPVTDQP